MGARGRRWSTVVGAFLIHLTLSTVYTLGNLNTYVISYLRMGQSELRYSDSIWIIATSISGQGALMCLGGCLQDRIGARWTCFLGCCIYTSMNALTNLTVRWSFVSVVLTLGLLSNLGMGITYGAALAVGMKCFPDRKGLVSGIIVGGFGLGAFVFTQVETLFLNPNNIAPNSDGYFTDKRVLDAVPNFFLLLGGAHAAMQIVGISLLFPPDHEKKLQLDNEKSILTKERPGFQRVLYTTNPFVPKLTMKNESPKKESSEPQYTSQIVARVTPPEEIIELSPKQMLKRKNFYLLWVTFALHIQIVQFVNNYYKAYGQTFIRDDHFLATIGSFGAVVNSIGRVIWGRLMDKSTYKICMLVLSTLSAAFMFSFIVSSSGGKALYAIWVLGLNATFCGIFVLLPSVTSQSFGQRQAGTNYGFVFTAPAISSVIGAFFINIMINKYSWFTSFLIFGGISEIAFIVTIFFPTDPTIR